MPLSTLEFSAPLTIDDFAAWTLHLHMANRERNRRLNYVMGAALFAALIGLPIVNLWLNASPRADFFCLLKGYFAKNGLEYALPLLAAAAAYVYFSRGKTLRRIIDRQYRSLVGPVSPIDQTQLYHYRFEEDGLRVNMPNVESAFQWAAFDQFFETPEHFFAAYPWGAFIAIPKRALSAEQIDEVRSWLREKIAPAGDGTSD